MQSDSTILIAGRYGLVGSAIERSLRAEGFTNIIGWHSSHYDLTKQRQVDNLFRHYEPEYVFFAAAKVGGIHANSTYPAEFIYSNLEIQNNVIHACYQYKVKKLLFLGSSCIYPRHAPQPIPESALLSGPLEETNKPYAVAKIAGITMCQAYNRQYGTNFICAMPTNLYGPGDRYHPDNSHVLPAMIHKFHEAKVAEDKSLTLWGSGAPMREFLYSDDCGDACVLLMQEYESNEIVNIGSGHEISVKKLAETVRQVVGFGGQIEWDRTKPDGTPRKLLDVSKLHGMGWRPRFGLLMGISLAYEDYLKGRGR